MTKPIKYKDIDMYALTLALEIVERCAVLRENVQHLMRISGFVKQYHYIKPKEGGKLFDLYNNRLKIIKRDLDILINIFKNILNNIIRDNNICYLYNEFYNIFEIFCKSTLEDSINLKSNEYELYKYFKQIEISERLEEILKKIELTSSNLIPFIIYLRYILDSYRGQSYQISIQEISEAIRAFRYSVDQSMRGAFVGHTIEQEPSIYNNKDLYHVIKYLTMYCGWYKYSLDNFVNNLFRIYNPDKNNIKNNIIKLKRLFECLSGVMLDYNDYNDSLYLVVVGDSHSPALIDRYKLISLPLVCAYRPRYWSAVAHEVAHTYINSLIYTKQAIEKIKIYYPEILDKDEYNNSSNVILYVFFGLLDRLNNMLLNTKIGDIFLEFYHYDDYKARQAMEITYIPEIIADVLAFMMCGYTYLDTISNILAFDYPTITGYTPFRIPYILRVYIIIELSKKFSKDKEINIFNNIDEKINYYFSKSKDDEKIKNSLRIIYNKIREDNIDILSNLNNYINDFINQYDIIQPLTIKFTKDYIELNTIKSIGLRIGSRIYEILKNKIIKDKDIFQILFGNCEFFGLIIPNNKLQKCYQVFSVLLNLILNINTFKRYNYIRDKVFRNEESIEYDVKIGNDLKKKINLISINIDTYFLFNYIKQLEWIESKILKNLGVRI